MKLKYFYLLLIFSGTINLSIAQITHISGSAGYTTNGISFVPTFSLNKPAAVFNFSAGNNKLSFDPEFSCDLNGRPWNIFLWLRYKLIDKQKFHFTVAVHPDFSFFTQSLSDNGIVQNYTTAQRYLTFDFVPFYSLSKNINVGVLYLYSKGISDISVSNGHFFSINSSFSNIKLFEEYTLKFVPQFYYLKLDDEDGIYFSSSITFSKKNFPFSLSSTNNKIIKTNIAGSRNYDWNISITYSFNNNYVKH